MAEEYNGWKNQATWIVNSLHMESILGYNDDGWHEEAIKGLILAECQTEDMTRTGRDLFMCAWGSVDWFISAPKILHISYFTFCCSFFPI